MKIILIGEDFKGVLSPLSEEELLEGITDGWVDNPSQIRAILKNIALMSDNIRTHICIGWAMEE